MKFTSNKLVLLYTVLLALLPFLWWPAGQHLVGGDDSKYEYIAPVSKLALLFSGDIGGLAVSEGAVIHEVSAYSFYLILAALREVLPFLNTQQLVNGLVFAGSFLAFFWMTSVLPAVGLAPGRILMLARFVAANVYSLSMFTMITMWSHQLPVFVYLATLPLTLGFFVRSTRQFTLTDSLAASLVLSLSPFPYASTPWLLPVVICGLPLGLALALERPKDTLLTIVTFFSATLVLLFPVWIAMTEFRAYSEGMFSTDSVLESLRVFKELNFNNSLFYPLGLSPHRWLLGNIPIYRSSPSLFESVVYLHAAIMIFFVIIFIVAIMRPITQVYRKVYVGVLLSWGLSLVLYTGGGTEIFFNLIVASMEAFPFLTMFRNNYDKFSMAIAFFSGLMVFYSLLLAYSFRSSNKVVYSIEKHNPVDK
jgi:hypothetical protein